MVRTPQLQAWCRSFPTILIIWFSTLWTPQQQLRNRNPNPSDSKWRCNSWVVPRTLRSARRSTWKKPFTIDCLKMVALKWAYDNSWIISSRAPSESSNGRSVTLSRSFATTSASILRLRFASYANLYPYVLWFPFEYGRIWVYKLDLFSVCFSADLRFCSDSENAIFKN